MINLLKEAILATDLSRHIQYVYLFLSVCVLKLAVWNIPIKIWGKSPKTKNDANFSIWGKKQQWQVGWIYPFPFNEDLECMYMYNKIKF